MGSLLDINFDNVPELKLLDDGTEISLRIKSVKEVPIKAEPSKNQYKVIFDDPSDLLVDDIINYLPMPTQADREEDEKAYAKAVGRLRDFVKCFGVDVTGGVNSDDFPGREGDCIVGVENDPVFGTKNVIKRFVVPK